MHQRRRCVKTAPGADGALLGKALPAERRKSVGSPGARKAARSRRMGAGAWRRSPLLRAPREGGARGMASASVRAPQGAPAPRSGPISCGGSPRGRLRRIAGALCGLLVMRRYYEVASGRREKQEAGARVQEAQASARSWEPMTTTKQYMRS